MNRYPEPENQRSFVVRVVQTLEKLHIQYAIGGSLAAMVYSAPRLTVDVDIMVLADAANLAQLVEEVNSWGIYIAPLEAILEQDLPHGLPFNIYDGTAGTRADLYPVRPMGLAGSAIGRRRRIRSELLDAEAWFLSPEDVILYKLDYFRQSEGVSQKHPKDISLMLRVMGDQLDLDYLQHWAARIDVLNLWQALWDEFHKP